MNVQHVRFRRISEVEGRFVSADCDANDRRDGFRGYFRRASGEVARQFVTQLGHRPPSITALRKVSFDHLVGAGEQLHR